MFHRYWLYSLVLCCAITACGGGSGGSSNSGAGTGSTPPDSTDTNPISTVVTGACAVDLESAILNQNDAGTVIIRDVGPGCDYSVNGRLQTNSPVVIQAGVTISLTPGSSISFFADGVQLLGESGNQIRFQAENLLNPWRSIVFGGDSTQIKHTLFSGGGLGVDAMIDLVGDDALVEDSTFSASASSALEIDDNDGSLVPMSGFRRNSFSDNNEYPLIIRDRYQEALDGGSDFSGGSLPNGEVAVRVDSGFSGRVNNIGVPFRISESFFSSGVTGGNLVLAPGVIVEFPELSKISLQGVSAEGTQSEPILFRGWPDSATGWDGVTLSGEVTMSHVTIQDGGSATGDLGAAVFLDLARASQLDEITFSNIRIEDSQSFGLACNDAGEFRASLENVTFEAVALTDVAPGCDLDIVQNEIATTLPLRQDVSNCTVTLNTSTDLPSVLTNSPSECDYYVVGSAGTTGRVAVEPGTVIYFARDADLSVGALVALGEETAPVKFAGEFQERGSWDGLTVSGDSVLQFVEVTEGGDELSAGVTVRDASTLAISDTSVSGSSGRGMTIDSTFGSSFTPGTGIEVFARNTFIDNGSVGLSLPIELIAFLDEQSLYDSVLMPNGDAGIHLADQVHSIGSILLSPRFGVPWRFTNYSASFDASLALSVDAGTEIIVEPNGQLELRGPVSMVGTVDSPILISGAGSDPTEWGGIFSSGSEVSAQNVVITGGGASEIGSTAALSRATIFLLGTLVSIDLGSVTIRDSQGWAISCARTRPTNIVLSNMTYESNTLGNIEPSCAE